MNKKFTHRLCIFFSLILGVWAYATPLKAANTYDVNELNGLRAFLRQANADGKLNLTGIGLTLADTANWNTDKTWVSKVEGLIWNAQTPKKITNIAWNYKKLSGNLDASAFTELDTLDCGSNQLTSLYVSKSTKLTYLDCSNYNQLISLDLSKNTELKYLNCSGNKQLSSLDVSKNTELLFLDFYDCPLPFLDLSKNTKLTNIHCGGEQLTSLDVTTNTELKILGCGRSQLTSLDLSKNTKLEELYLWSLTLSSLDVSKNTEIRRLSCEILSLTSIDLSKNTKLESFICSNNPLTSLDVSKNTELEELKLSKLPLTSLDLSENTKLGYLGLTGTQIHSLDVTKNTQLSFLECNNNQIISLDMSKNTELEFLYCDDNPLSSLDVSKNTELSSLSCAKAQLSSLDMTKNTELKYIDCSYNQLASLDLSKNTKLRSLDCSSNRLPLSSLYPFMNLSSEWMYLSIGNQTNVFFKDTNLAVYGKLDLSSESEFRGAKTRFKINTEAENYTINEGVICFLKKGTYQITLSNDSIYSDTAFQNNAAIAAVVKTGTITVNDVSSELTPSEDEIRVFPNPSKDKLFISGQKPIQRLILYNVNGAVLLQIEKPKKDFDVNISSLAPGMYFLNIDGQSQKIIKN